MLEKYKDGQPVAYNVFMNAIKNNKLSHAYLVDANGNSDAYDIVMSFVKMIICNNGEDNSDVIAKRIDDGNYLDVKVIEPNGMWIKKDQVLELEEEFNKKAIEGSKKIYIIKEADKMNVHTANTILKFLEEPVDDIIAFLIVNNTSLVLPTIVSRCQLIRLNRNDYAGLDIDNFNNLFSMCKLNENEKIEFIDNAIMYVENLEKNKLDMIIYNKKYWHDKFKNREDSVMAIELIINFYYDILKYKTVGKIDFFKNREEEIKKIENDNSVEDLVKKLEVACRIKNYFMSNLNINLLLDRFVIEMCGD